MAKKDLSTLAKSSAALANNATAALQNMGVLRPKDEDPEIRATFIIRQSIQHKVKMICAMEHRQIKDVADEIFTQYIENWEKKNGAIPNL